MAGRSRTTLGLAGMVMAGVLTGCGGGDDGSGGETASEDSGFTDQTAQEIMDAGLKATKGAESLRLAGTVETDGQQVTLDLALNTDGDCTGTFSAGQGEAEILSVGSVSYLRADKRFWRSMAGDQAEMMITMVGDKWLKMPSGQDDFADFCDLDSLLSQFDSDDLDADAEKGEVEDVDGAEAITLTGAGDDGGDVTVWVATADDHYILQFEQTGGKEPGSVTLSDFDAKLDVTAPATGDVLDLSKM